MHIPTHEVYQTLPSSPVAMSAIHRRVWEPDYNAMYYFYPVLPQVGERFVGGVCGAQGGCVCCVWAAKGGGGPDDD